MIRVDICEVNKRYFCYVAFTQFIYIKQTINFN